MIHLNHIKATNTFGPTVHFHCAACEADATGSSWDHCERMMVLGVIPAFRKTTTYVQCGRCKTKYVSTQSTAYLAQYRDSDITAALRPKQSLVVTGWVLASLALSFWPIFGLVLGIVAIILTRKDRGGWRRRIAILSTIVTVPFSMLFMWWMISQIRK